MAKRKNGDGRPASRKTAKTAKATDGMDLAEAVFDMADHLQRIRDAISRCEQELVVLSGRPAPLRAHFEMELAALWMMEREAGPDIAALPAFAMPILREALRETLH